MKSLFTASSLLSGMNSGQKTFLSNKTVQGSATASEWLARFAEIGRFDKVIGSARGWASFLLLAGIVLGVVGGVNQQWWLLGIGVVLGLFGLTFLITLGGKDVHDNLRKFVMPIIGMLNEDIGEEEPLALEIDLLGTCRKSKRTAVRSWPSSELPRGVTNCKDSIYTDPWLKLNTRLVDGTRLGFAVSEQLLERRKGKRSVSGKYKIKHKYKNKRTIVLRLRPADDNYVWHPDLVAAVEAGQPLALDKKMTATIKSAPGKPATLLLRHDHKEVLASRPGNSTTVDPGIFVKMMGAATGLVGPPPVSSEISH